MKRFFLIATLLVGYSLIALESKAQPTLREARVVFDLHTYDEASADAMHFEGDLLLYFYRADSPEHQQILTGAFSRAALAAYINDNFARLAVPLDTLADNRLRYYYREASEGAFVVLMRLLRPVFPSDFLMYGWENIQDDASEAQALAILRHFKDPKDQPQTRSDEAALSCAAGADTWLIVNERERCWIEHLQARCDRKEDQCLVSCMAGGRWRRIGGGCFHVCLAYKDHAWTEPEGFRTCDVSRER